MNKHISLNCLRWQHQIFIHSVACFSNKLIFQMMLCFLEAVSYTICDITYLTKVKEYLRNNLEATFLLSCISFMSIKMIRHNTTYWIPVGKISLGINSCYFYHTLDTILFNYVCINTPIYCFIRIYILWYSKNHFIINKTSRKSYYDYAKRVISCCDDSICNRCHFTDMVMPSNLFFVHSI